MATLIHPYLYNQYHNSATGYDKIYGKPDIFDLTPVNI